MAKMMARINYKAPTKVEMQEYLEDIMPGIQEELDNGAELTEESWKEIKEILTEYIIDNLEVTVSY